MEPLISVIVPVYNSELYLNKCVDSIINQIYKNLEIILVDDGSMDKSSQICDGYSEKDSRIKVIHKENGGLSSARNAGLDVCTGDYIGFVDSDDWIDSEMYSTLLSICKTKNTVATAALVEINEKNDINYVIKFGDEITSKDFLIKSILCQKDSGSVCTRLFPKEVVADYRFDETKLNEDILFMTLIMKNVETAAYSSLKGYYYYCREESISRHFGKAVHDMVGNSTQVRKQIDQLFPAYKKEAEYFEISQHMNFLLCCPYDYERDKDPLCGKVLSYIRKNLLAGMKNPCLNYKKRLMLFGLALSPKFMALLIEIRKKKR